MKEWETVTGQKQKPRAQKSKQLPTARGLAEIRDTEISDGKSPKWRDQITFDLWGQRVVNGCYGKSMIFKEKKLWKEPVSN